MKKKDTPVKYFRWARIQDWEGDRWTIAEFDSKTAKTFLLPGCPSQCSVRGAKRDWGEGFRWGKWVERPSIYKDKLYYEGE